MSVVELFPQVKLNKVNPEIRLTDVLDMRILLDDFVAYPDTDINHGNAPRPLINFGNVVKLKHERITIKPILGDRLEFDINQNEIISLTGKNEKRFY